MRWRRLVVVGLAAIVVAGDRSRTAQANQSADSLASDGLAVVLLLDVSMSTSSYDGLGVARDSTSVRFAPPGRRDEHGNRLESAVREGVIDRLRPGDRAQIGSIGGGPINVVPTLTADREALLAAARRAIDVPERDRQGPSPIWDGAFAAIDALTDEPGRRVVILWTDGEATGNWHSSDEVLQHARDTGVSICVVWEGEERHIVQSANTALVVNPGARLAEVSEATGGIFLHESTWTRNPRPLFSRMLDQLHGE